MLWAGDYSLYFLNIEVEVFWYMANANTFNEPIQLGLDWLRREATYRHIRFQWRLLCGQWWPGELTQSQQLQRRHQRPIASCTAWRILRNHISTSQTIIRIHQNSLPYSILGTLWNQTWKFISFDQLHHQATYMPLLKYNINRTQWSIIWGVYLPLDFIQ